MKKTLIALWLLLFSADASARDLMVNVQVMSVNGTGSYSERCDPSRPCEAMGGAVLDATADTVRDGTWPAVILACCLLIVATVGVKLLVGREKWINA